MADHFHNPYHFVPLPENAGGPRRTALPDDEQDLPVQVTHDRFVKNTFSGSIRCRLTTITPMVIGAKQTGEAPKQVHPFLVPGTSDPGIPASALRGLISSIFETTTRSAFRVLADRIFSYRKGMPEGLSALGLPVETTNGLQLYPLAMQHRSIYARREADLDFSKGANIPKNSGNYSKVFPSDCRKVYFGSKDSIRDPQFHAVFSSNSAAHGGPFYALPISERVQKIRPPLEPRTFRPGTYFDLGDLTNVEPEPWDDSIHKESTHTRGILRVLGLTSETRNKGMPTKKHEFFIPLSKAEETSLRDETALVFPILPEAIERFNQLADERTKEANEKTPREDLLPFTPHGQNRTPTGESDPKRPKRAYHLKQGDLVFFRPTADGQAVAEISLSSIWRGRVEKGTERSKSAATLADFIDKADPDLLPMGDPRKTRLTPAELLFGFTEHKGQRALAGRLRFSIAKPLPNQGALLHSDWINLQVLNSPKPPSPNFYFRQRPKQRWIPKSSLTLAKDQIQGRKFYLHTEGLHPEDPKQAKSPDDPRWTMHPHNSASGDYDRMRVQVRPVLANKLFEFEIRFDNLTRFELGALIHALHPAKEFCHKLGMGKPLGLGTVRLDPLLIERVERYQRYYATDPLDKPRVHASWQGDPDSGTWSGPTKDAADGPAEWVQSFLAELKPFDPNETALKALLTIGDPSKVQHPVHYPQVSGLEPGDAAFESDRYEWFVTNDQKNTNDADRQHIGQVGDTLPFIKRLPKTERGDGERGRPGGGGARPQGGAPHAGNRHQDQAGGGWQGPVNCVCTGQGQRGDWKFEFRDASGVHWRFLDRNASAPPDLRPGQGNLRMFYTTDAQGRCFFKPA